MKPSIAIEAISRTEFQQMLRRLADDPDAGLQGEDARKLVAWIVGLNAVLVQALRVFFEDSARTDTPARAALALALHQADPGKFSFAECEACVTPQSCACPSRQRWLEECRFRIVSEGRMAV